MTDSSKPVKCGCGGEAKVILDMQVLSKPAVEVKCEKCGIMIIRQTNKPSEAISAWNRAMGERTAKVVGVEKPIIGDEEGKTIRVTSCSACENVVSIFDNFCPSCGAKLLWGDDNE